MLDDSFSNGFEALDHKYEHICVIAPRFRTGLDSTFQVQVLVSKDLLGLRLFKD